MLSKQASTSDSAQPPAGESNAKPAAPGFFDDVFNTFSDFGKSTSDTMSNLYTHATKLGNPVLLTHAGAEKMWKDHFYPHPEGDEEESAAANGEAATPAASEPREGLRFFFFCNLVTSVGPCAGTLFVTDQSLYFLSDAELEYNVHPEELEMSYYRVQIPLNCISGMAPKANPTNDTDRYIKVVTADGFQFWFTAFLSYDQAFASLLAALQECGRPADKVLLGAN